MKFWNIKIKVFIYFQHFIISLFIVIDRLFTEYDYLLIIYLIKGNEILEHKNKSVYLLYNTL